jgi:hypothetical protein
MTLCATAAPSSDPPPGGPARATDPASETSGRGVLCIWLVACLLAVVTWWPLGLRSGSGLHGGDIYTYFFPLKAWYADRLHAGEIPLWNPLIGLGFPALGESQTGVFYLPNLLLYRSLGLNQAYHVGFLLHYVLAFGFTCHYVRRLGFTGFECILAGVIFVYGWFPARSCLEWAIVTGAWIPLAFWGAEWFVQQGRLRCLIPVAIAVVMQLLAGHFNLAFVTLVGLGAYVPLRLMFDRRPISCVAFRSAQLVWFVALACAIGAIQIVPSWELKGRSQRGEAQFGAHQVGYGAIPWSYLGQAIAPWDFYPKLHDPEFERQQLGDRNTNRVEAHLYFGLIPMCLAAVGIVTTAFRALRRTCALEDRAVWVWLLVGSISLTLAAGALTNLVVHLPGFGYFTGPGRYGVLLQLASAVIACAGARRLIEWTRALLGWKPWASWAITIGECVLIGVLTQRWTEWSGGASEFLGSFLVVQEGWLSPEQCALVLFLLGLTVATALAFLRRPGWLLAITAVAASWLDVTSVTRYVQFAEIRSDSPIQYREHSTVRSILQPLAPIVRLLARDQNAVSLCEVPTLPVYLGIGPREYFSGPLQIPADFHWENTVSPSTKQWLRWAGVTHILSFDAMVDDDLKLVWAGHDLLLHGLLGRSPNQRLWLYALEGARGRCYWIPEVEAATALAEPSNEPLHITPIPSARVAANEVTLSLSCVEPAVVVLTELNYPGWIAAVDGKEQPAAANTPFRAVHVAAGDHEIRWLYRPRSLTIAYAITAAGFVALCLTLWKDSRNKNPAVR